MRTPTRTVACLAAALAACVASGCETAPTAPALHSARPVVETARWQVVSADAVIGHVVQLEIRDPSGALPFFRIEDLQGRWLGYASQNRRFSRRVPFQDRDEDLGVWPMANGVAKLFDAAAPVTLRPLAVEADARRER